ncbi:hypothetical protein C0585_06805 [Candidatus Woesearchaeota archaeon]|nr:MAG: hypothetical protein C0585_06805 [Candidatus Woesearchaeota archaeon]
MGWENLFDLLVNMPGYLVVSILLTFLLWSKFQNKGKFKLNNSNSVIDLIVIWLFLFITALFTFFLGTYFSNRFNLDFDISKSWEITQLGIIFAGIGFIFIFFIIYRNKHKCSKKDLGNWFISLLFIQLFFLIILIKNIIIIALIPYLHEFLAEGIILFILFLMLLMICFIIYNVYFKSIFNNFDKSIKEFLKKDKNEKLAKNFNTKKFIIYAIPIIILLGIISTIISIPFFSYGDEKLVNYYIDHGNSEYIYRNIEVPIKIKNNFGLMTSTIPLIPINYGKYNIDTSADHDDKFELLTDKNNKIIDGFYDISNNNLKDSFDRFGFEKILLNENKGMILLKFNKFKIKDQNISKLILKGFVKEDRNKRYEYDDLTTCENNTCKVSIYINNKLNYSVGHYREYIYRLEENKYNLSKCFMELNALNTTTNIQRDTSWCDDKECGIELGQNKYDDIINAQFRIEENGILRADFIEIDIPSTINIKFTIKC